jgi:hypothetical protein
MGGAESTVSSFIGAECLFEEHNNIDSSTIYDSDIIIGNSIFDNTNHFHHFDRSVNISGYH